MYSFQFGFPQKQTIFKCRQVILGSKLDLQVKRVQYPTACQQAEAQPALRTPHQAHQVHAGHDTIQEVCSIMPYKQHIMRQLKVLKLIKSAHIHAKRKWEELSNAASHEEGCAQSQCACKPAPLHNICAAQKGI